LNEALLTGTRGLEIARRSGDLTLRLVMTTYLEQAHYFRGDYERVVELATDNLAVLPAHSDYEFFGAGVPIAIYDRYRLLQSLTELGRFSEAAQYAAQAVRLAESMPTPHAYTVGMVYEDAGVLYLRKGDWAKARTLMEHGIAVLRAANIVLTLSGAGAKSAWILAQAGPAREALTRLQEAKELLERAAAGGSYALPRHAYTAPACGALTPTLPPNAP